ncbi:MAG: methyltransferase domain-containing protein [Actinobacteria bacterium]|nr:methyltransferase domain-containing protein [Actinomycetota bacterium]
MNPPQARATATDERVLNELDTYGPAYMRIAEALGGYEETAQEAEQVIELLGLQEGDLVLDAACGFGRFAEALSRHGIEAVGIDISPAAIAEAQRRCPGPRYLVHDLTQPLPDGVGPFDALVNVYSSFGYGITESEDQEMLACFHRALRPGGWIVMQLSDLERSRHRLRSDAEPVVRWTNGVKETLTVDFSSGRLHVRYELDGDEVHSRIRMYEKEDLVRMLEEAGFGDVSMYGDFTGKPKEPADRLVLVARA